MKTKLESKEIPRVDLVFIQNEFQSHVETNSRKTDSSSQDDDAGEYAYSFSMPAARSEGVPTSSEMESDTDPSDAPIEANVEENVRYEKRSLRIPPLVPILRSLKFSQLRILGLLGWTAIAGAGAVAVMLEASPSIDLQLGTLSGVWFAVSAAIWFVPSKLAP